MEEKDVIKAKPYGQGCFQVPGLEYTNILFSDVLEVNFSTIILILETSVLLKAVCGLVQAAKQFYKKSMCMSDQKMRFHKVKDNEYLLMKKDSSGDKAASSPLGQD